MDASPKKAGRSAYAMPGTDMQSCYAVPGTDVQSCYAGPGTDLPDSAISLPRVRAVELFRQAAEGGYSAGSYHLGSVRYGPRRICIAGLVLTYAQWHQY
eukprot:129682-Rhodomonas_salina.1